MNPGHVLCTGYFQQTDSSSDFLFYHLHHYNGYFTLHLKVNIFLVEEAWYVNIISCYHYIYRNIYIYFFLYSVLIVPLNKFIFSLSKEMQTHLSAVGTFLPLHNKYLQMVMC